MSVAEKIHQYLQRLPENSQAEVLDFVEFLVKKSEQVPIDQERREWAKGSLSAAMRGMESETEPDYSPADIKEHFS
ncbi:DUF2281 domain-containing protein [Fodinibius sediminis]|uniref:DUF2281 domain-containing protein n=1 Tax=Fodinibius sediminis TaxID=1214077 RepID=A0A521FFB2_9BACT|nr:DUF2281 domain-containing protein [Fodinibius sediminis]SMO94341.1 Protein of unknown function [Fodinibius sediminis]